MGCILLECSFGMIAMIYALTGINKLNWWRSGRCQIFATYPTVSGSVFFFLFFVSSCAFQIVGIFFCSTYNIPRLCPNWLLRSEAVTMRLRAFLCHSMTGFLFLFCALCFANTRVRGGEKGGKSRMPIKVCSWAFLSRCPLPHLEKNKLYLIPFLRLRFRLWSQSLSHRQFTGPTAVYVRHKASFIAVLTIAVQSAPSHIFHSPARSFPSPSTDCTASLGHFPIFSSLAAFPRYSHDVFLFPFPLLSPTLVPWFLGCLLCEIGRIFLTLRAGAL